MKKRFISFLLLLSLCLTFLPVHSVLASEANQGSIIAVAEEDNQLYSLWAEDDLIVGDTYGIYPNSWYGKGMMKPITRAQLSVLIAGIRGKLVNSGHVTEINYIKPLLSNEMTVEEVLNAFYGILSGYDYSQDIGLKKRYAPAAYMAEYGIFTGQEGELSYKDVCTVEQACVIATRLITYLYNALDAASKGFLWETKYGDNTVYMLGSIHMASYDIYPFSNKILEAFAKSDALAVELNILDSSASMVILEYALYNDGTTLKDHVSEEIYQKTIELAALLGYVEEEIAMFKPWFIYSLFSSLSIGSGNAEEVAVASGLGIDLKFTTDAWRSGKSILEIEGYEFQAKVLDSFSDELEEFLLAGTIMTLNEILAGTRTPEANSLDIMLDYWRDGDVEAFKKYISPKYELLDFENKEVANYIELYKEYEDKLMKQRDQGMADYIDQLLKAEGSATYFVVVGSGHYISDYSVLDILMEKGYEINQIK